MIPAKTKILVIGAGSIGLRHIRNLRSLGYKNIAVCDSDGTKQIALKRIGIDAFYGKESDAFRKEKPDITFVCNPTHSHVSSARAAIESGSDVFIEKPLSYDLRGIDGLARRAARKNRIVMVACNWRFHRGFVTLAQVLAGKTYGAAIAARVACGYFLPDARPGADYKKTYAAQKLGGGVVLDSGSHVVNYLSALFGGVKKTVVMPSALHPLGIRSEEAAAMILEHEQGVIASVAMDYVSKPSVHRLDVTTDKGILTLDFIKDELIFENGATKKIVYRGTGDLNQMFLDELRHFFDCVAKRKKPLQDLAGAKRVLEILLQGASVKN